MQVVSLATFPQDVANVGNDLEEFLNSKYVFRYNTVNGLLSWKNIGDTDFQEWNEYHLNSILRACESNNCSASKTKLMQLLKSDFTPKFDPFKDYLNNLPNWDNKTDYITELADTLVTTNQQYFHTCFKKWFVGMVGSMIDNGAYNETAIILSGAQGIGKTRFIKSMVPAELSNYYYSGTIFTQNKDSITNLADCFLINMEEGVNIKKTIDKLKGLMSLEMINIRRPYCHFTESLIRRASFIGSVNEKEFLNDETGSRRFLCFEVLQVKDNHSLDLKNIYGQALALYKSGVQYWFNAEENKALEINNYDYQQVNFYSEIIEKYFQPATKENATNQLTPTEIMYLLNDRARIPTTEKSLQQIGKYFTSRGYIKQKRKDQQKAYLLIDNFSKQL